MWRCEVCRGALLAPPAKELSPAAILRKERSLWRYLPWLALSAHPLVSLGEGWTPLIPKAVNGTEVLWKCDFINPSGRLRIGGIAVMVNYLARAGIRRVAETLPALGCFPGDLCSRGGDELPDLRAGSDIGRQGRADRGDRVRGRAHRRRPPGRYRGGDHRLRAGDTMQVTTGIRCSLRAPKQWATKSGSSSASPLPTPLSCRSAVAAISSGAIAHSARAAGQRCDRQGAAAFRCESKRMLPAGRGDADGAGPFR